MTPRYVGKRCLVAGWGYISRVRLANALQETNLTVTPRDECEEALERTVTRSHMCAKALGGNSIEKFLASISA